jgi:hypothetical protein
VLADDHVLLVKGFYEHLYQGATAPSRPTEDA